MKPSLILLGALALGACGPPERCTVPEGLSVADSETGLCGDPGLLETIKRASEVFPRVSALENFDPRGWSVRVLSGAPGRAGAFIGAPGTKCAGAIVAGCTDCVAKRIDLGPSSKRLETFAHELAHVAEACLERPRGPSADLGHLGWSAEGVSEAIRRVIQ